MDLKLSGKRALVTGSTAGIGFSIAKLLAREGAFVYVNGRTEERVKKAVAEIEGKVDGVAADLTTEQGAEKLFTRVEKLDILVNNFGIFEVKPFLEIEDAEWRRYFEANVLSGVRMTRHYLPQMLEKKWGRIIFISSESGLQIPAEMVHYGMTKTAQLAVARGIAESFPGERCHGELCAARPYGERGRIDIRGGTRKATGQDERRCGERVLRTCPSQQPDKAFRNDG